MSAKWRGNARTRTRESDADDLGVDGGAAALGVIQLLEHEHRAALREREAVAALVEWPRRVTRVIVVSVLECYND